MTTSQNNTNVPLLAALEQSLVSQLVIVPTLYYPMFYAITGAMQGMTIEQTMGRAKDTFIPLMKYTPLFWIPVQFAVFGFVEEILQIPIMIVCGLIWNIILSILAGSVEVQEDDDEYYVLSQPSCSFSTILCISIIPPFLICLRYT
jgi:protein Mpv17